MRSVFKSGQASWITERHDVDMLVWDLRQAGDLIGWSIVSPASGKVKSIVKRSNLEDLLDLSCACIKGLRRFWPLIGWTASLAQSSKKYVIALGAAEIELWIVWCRYDEKACSLDVLDAICLNCCGESATWLIGIEARMSNSGCSQRPLFCTNWTRLSQRLGSGWPVDKA